MTTLITEELIADFKKKLSTVKLKKVDEDRKKFLCSRPWWTTEHSKLQKYISSFVEGSHIVANHSDEKEVKNILKGGGMLTVPDEDEVLMNMMRKSDCHNNALELLAKGKITECHSGFSLSNDGLWRHHSWGVDKNNRIVETTEIRLAYLTGGILKKI